jgi:hypothetical protein
MSNGQADATAPMLDAMNIQTHIPKAAALAAVLALAIAGPADARGGGGTTGGGGSGGGTTTPAPAPVANADPCGSIQGPGPIAPESTKANLRLDYKVTNCSAASESVVLSVSGVQTSGNVPTPCQTATVSLPFLTLKPDETRGLSVDAPGQADCRLGLGSYTYTATLTEAVTGAVLATDTTTVMRMGGV